MSQACSDASYLKTMLVAQVTFFLVIFVPFLGMVGLAGLWFTRIALPVLLLRWWIRYHSIHTHDPDYLRARRTAMLVPLGYLVLLATFYVHIR